jgi:hypothetical protein
MSDTYKIITRWRACVGCGEDGAHHTRDLGKSGPWHKACLPPRQSPGSLARDEAADRLAAEVGA